MKIHLVKTLTIPILDYPPIPIHTLSKNQLSQLQVVQNKALRFAYNQRYPYNYNTEQLHAMAKTEPLNIRIHNRAVQIWENIETRQIPLYTQLTQNMINVENYHIHFPCSLSKINNPPELMFL